MLNQRLRGLPQTQLKPEQTAALRNELETIGFFDWAQIAAPSGEGGLSMSARLIFYPNFLNANKT